MSRPASASRASPVSRGETVSRGKTVSRGGTVGIKDVAALAGVSTGTVSNVLNRPHLVTAATRERVQTAIRELGFVRNESARQLRVGRSRMIGLVVLDVANPFFTDVALGVEQEVGEAGLSVILCNSDDHLTRQTRHLELLQEQHPGQFIDGQARTLQ